MMVSIHTFPVGVFFSALMQLVTGLVQCPKYYVPLDNSCFRFYKTPLLSWDDARRRCESEGSHLAVIDTVSKRDTLISYMIRKNIILRYWVDGREPKDDGYWVWSSNGKPVYSGIWFPGEPNDSGGEDCMQFFGHSYQTSGLNDKACKYKFPFICESYPVNGAWGGWGSWSTCSMSCGTLGLRYRTRLCNNPVTIGTGKPCPGADRQTELCFPGQCPGDGVWGVWTHWSTCSKTCGQGNRTRHRACNSPPPTNGGKYCSGQSVQVETCSVQLCPAKLCPDLFTEVTDSLCLYISDPKTEAYNYFLSMKACSSLSPLSRMMTVKNTYEYHNIVRFLSTAAEYWIGDDTSSGSSSLSNGGTNLGTGSFTIWDAGFPSARSLTNCIDLSGKSGAFLWQDAPCWERKPFICELRPKDAFAPIVG